MHPRFRTQLNLMAHQLGHITRPQLRDLGMTAPTLRRRVAAGELVQVGAITFRSGSVLPTVVGDVMAACLDIGGVASHRTAAWLHGLAPDLHVIDVTVLKGRSTDRAQTRSRTGLSIRRHATTSLPAADLVEVRRVPATGVARTLLGLGALVPSELSGEALLEFMCKAIDSDLASEPWLWWTLERRRCRGRNGISAFEAALAERCRLGPTESWLERELQRVFERFGVPAMRTQAVIRRLGRFAARVDFVSDEAPIVVEALGYAYHRTREQLEADTRRAAELQAAGHEVYQFTSDQITQRPAWVAGIVLEALRRHGCHAA